MPDIFCGIDLGTQGARCALLTEDGRMAAEGERRLPAVKSSLPDGWFEQETGAWRKAVAGAVGEALGTLEPGFGAPRDIRAVGVTSTSGTLVALGPGGRPLLPAIMYNDARARRQADEVQAAGTALTRRLGYRFSASFGLPKILWLKQERPEIYRQAALFCSPTDFVIGWLTGAWSRSDQTNMLKFGYDLLEERWPDFIEQGLGIDRALLPNVQMSGERAGRVTAERTEQLGLPEGTPVVAGLTDGCASQISSGAAAPGQYNTTLGTTMVIKGVSEKLLIDPRGRIYCHRHPAGWWLPGGASNTGAECLAQEFGEEETRRRSLTALNHSPTDLVAYPRVGTGERFPFLEPEAEGFLVGEPTDRDKLFAACLEGVACLERLAYEVLERLGAEVGHRIYSAGGGAASDAWLQIRADTLRRTVVRPEQTGAATGAAILAASLARYPDLAEAARAMVRIETEVPPRPDRLAAYAGKYAAFCRELQRRGNLPEQGKSSTRADR